MTDTPITDGHANLSRAVMNRAECAYDLARDLERRAFKYRADLAEAEAQIERWRDSNRRFREEMERQARMAQELRDILQWLVDLQNGCPLPKYEKNWDWTMARARRLLDSSTVERDGAGPSVT